MKNPFVSRILKRVHKQDKDAIILVGGPRGSTKSGVSITLGDAIDRDQKTGEPRFRLSEEYFPKGFTLAPNDAMPRVLFQPSIFLKMLAKGDLPPGSAIIWDETGVEADARDFQSKKNKLLKRTLETVRSMNLVLFLTAPTVFSYDISLRRSASYYIECSGAIRTAAGGRYGKTRIYKIQTNSKTGKTYYKLLRYYEPVTGRVAKLERFDVPKPPAYLERPYKRYKKLFQTTLYKEYARELSDMKGLSEDDGKVDLEDLVGSVLKSPTDFFDVKKNKFLVAPMRAKFGVSRLDAYELKQLLEFRLSKGEIQI